MKIMNRVQARAEDLPAFLEMPQVSQADHHAALHTTQRRNELATGTNMLDAWERLSWGGHQ